MCSLIGKNSAFNSALIKNIQKNGALGAVFLFQTYLKLNTPTETKAISI